MKWRVAFFLASASLAGAAGILSACSSDDNKNPMTGPDASVSNVACTNGLTMCNGACVDIEHDRSNCGECGLVCNTKASEVCKMGQCVFGCSGSTTKCGDNCFDLGLDPGNCGMCGNKCQPGYVCSDGGCAVTCMQGLTACDADGGPRCANTFSDEHNCGGCGITCDPGYLCDQGMCGLSCQPGLSTCSDNDGGQRCTDLDHDNANCGGCGKACINGTFCSPGASVDGGDAGPATCGLKCFGGTTKCGNKCVDTAIDSYNCGGCNVACDGGTKCVNSMCQ